LLHLVDSSILLYLIDDARSNKNHISDSSSVHYQEFIHCTLSNGMSYRFVDSFRAGPEWNQFHPGPPRKLSKNLYDIYHCLV